MRRDGYNRPMHINRRELMRLATAGATAGLLAHTTTNALADDAVAGATTAPHRPIKAIAFDAFTVFDPRSVVAIADGVFPGKGAEFAAAWRTRQFEYCWLRTLTGHYADFWHVTADALDYTARAMKLDLSAAQRDTLMNAYLALPAYPDAQPALRAMKQSGLRLAFLSNMTAEMLTTLTKRAGIADLFDPHLSTDAVRAYKPDPRAYQMGLDAFGLPREQIAFSAFGGWDAAGAKAFGYPTFWVNRLGLPIETLDTTPDAQGGSLIELQKFVTAGAAADPRG
jgi:2-haloacid dehalogenase